MYFCHFCESIDTKKINIKYISKGGVLSQNLFSFSLILLLSNYLIIYYIISIIKTIMKNVFNKTIIACCHYS